MVKPSRPTLDEVAAAAGVSRATASRAINGEAKVSPSARAAVQDAVSKLGFVPNRAARTLVTRRTDTVALVVPEPDELVLSDPFIMGAITGLSQALAPTDLQLVLLIAEPGKGASKATRFLERGQADGIIVVSHHESDEVIKAAAAMSVPLVLMGRPVESTAPVSFVDVDNIAGGRMAGEFLLKLGRRRLGTVAGPADMAAGVDRLVGWQQALSAGTHPGAPVLLTDDDAAGSSPVAYGDFSVRGGANAARELMSEHPDLDGIFVASDLMAVGVIQVLTKMGKRVPEDVAIIGFDNLDVAAGTTPPLTTLVNPVREMVREAGRMLIEHIDGKPLGPTASVIFDTRLVRRQSA